jgi:hypothetical protein
VAPDPRRGLRPCCRRPLRAWRPGRSLGRRGEIPPARGPFRRRSGWAGRVRATLTCFPNGRPPLNRARPACRPRFLMVRRGGRYPGRQPDPPKGPGARPSEALPSQIPVGAGRLKLLGRGPGVPGRGGKAAATATRSTPASLKSRATEVCLNKVGLDPSKPAFLASPATRRQTRAPGLRPDGSWRPTGPWAAPKGPLWPPRLLKSPGSLPTTCGRTGGSEPAGSPDLLRGRIGPEAPSALRQAWLTAGESRPLGRTPESPGYPSYRSGVVQSDGGPPS